MTFEKTAGLVEEFFRQGDAERELGIPFSPLCDRETTMVSQSQIGFIDFIITPTYTLLTKIFEAINEMLLKEAEEMENDSENAAYVQPVSLIDIFYSFTAYFFFVAPSYFWFRIWILNFQDSIVYRFSNYIKFHKIIMTSTMILWYWQYFLKIRKV